MVKSHFLQVHTFQNQGGSLDNLHEVKFMVQMQAVEHWQSQALLSLTRLDSLHVEGKTC